MLVLLLMLVLVLSVIHGESVNNVTFVYLT